MSDANLRYRSGVEFTYTEPNTYTSSGVGESTILATAFPLRMLLISPSFSLTYSRKNLNGSMSCPLAARALAKRIPASNTLAVRTLAPQHVFMISPICDTPFCAVLVLASLCCQHLSLPATLAQLVPASH